MSNLVRWGGNVPSTAEFIIGDPKKKGTKVKKMVGADPGLGMEVEILSDTDVRVVELEFKLFIDELPADPVTASADHSVLWGVKSGETEYLQFPNTYRFLVPFVDSKWLKENHEGKPLFYCVIVSYDGTSIGNSSGGFPAAGLKPDQKFVYSTSLLGSGPYSPPANGGVQYSNVIFHALGVAWTETYADDNPTGTNILAVEEDITSYFVPFSSGGGYDKIGEESVCFLEYPVLAGNLALTPIDYTIRTFYDGSTVDFQPPSSGFSAASGAMTLDLTAPPS